MAAGQDVPNACTNFRRDQGLGLDRHTIITPANYFRKNDFQVAYQEELTYRKFISVLFIISLKYKGTFGAGNDPR